MRIQATARLGAVGILLAATAVACNNDLTVQPVSTITSANIFTDSASYRAFLAKLYSGLVVTGQTGPDGNPDIGGIDEGFSQYVRGYWQLQELPTDEAIIGWNDIGLPELNTQTWSASNPFVNAMYSRIFYQVALANQFLRETTDEKLTSRGTSASLVTQVHQYRAEARFLRALSYYHALDLFGNVPVVDENFDVTKLPTQATRSDVFNFVEKELKDVIPLLPAAKTGQYGRADQGAANMVLAHLYLQAKVYTGTDHSADARAAVEKVIASNAYSLDNNFRRIFSADNNTSPEIIFAVPQDGVHTQTWGGMTYLVHAGVGGNMAADAYGIDGGWWGLRLRQETVQRYEGGATGPDHRTSFFFTNGQTMAINNIGDFQQGIGAPKFTNVKSTGGSGSNATFPDTDFPMFRLADAYLIYAEAVLRGGGGSAATALNYVNLIRERAYGGTSGDITATQLTLPFILDERSRELLWEGFRRQDLIRFGQFTDQTVWTWKGGVPAGKTTEAFRNLYPIPANELSANPNIKQNPGY
jgi:starch-binding outer membrane protein, SusD/RagB family